MSNAQIYVNLYHKFLNTFLHSIISKIVKDAHLMKLYDKRSAAIINTSAKYFI